jgi:hypothetical protein
MGEWALIVLPLLMLAAQVVVIGLAVWGGFALNRRLNRRNSGRPAPPR